MANEKKGTALAVRPAQTTALNKTTGDVPTLQRALEEGSKQGHLVSPATSCGSLPEGFEVAISAVKIDTTPASKETYAIPGSGGLGLSKVSLDKIAGAAGVSWDPVMSRRLDDGSDPHYCRFQVVGRYRHFDSQWVTIMATKEMDLRDGSAQVEAMWDRYRSSKEKWDSGQRGERSYPPKEPTGQISEMRLHIESHAETKARLRAIRSLGIKTSYTAQELAKPFVVAKLMATGRSSDPELHREFAKMQFAAAVGAGEQLYGGAPVASAPMLQRPAPPQALLPAAPPPPLPGPSPDSDPGPDPEAIDAEATSNPGHPDPGPEPEPESPPKQTGGMTPPGAVWPWPARRDGDPERGTQLTEVDSYQLQRLADYYRDKPGDERFAAANAAVRKAAEEILDARGETRQPGEGRY